MSITATVANMKLAESQGMSVVAVDCEGESFSATSGDYWNYDPDEALTDEHGCEMVLGRPVSAYAEIIDTLGI